MGIYSTKANNLRRVVKRFNYIKKRGDGGSEPEENDMEALVRSITKYHKADNVILIADNNSCIRDFRLINNIDEPIKIVLCNTEDGINPQYLNLAYRTGGSIHTESEDIYAYIMRTVAMEKKPLLINGVEYIINDDNLFEYKDKSLANQHNCSLKTKKGIVGKIFGN